MISLNEFKSQADKLKNELGVGYKEALDVVAKNNGFSEWKLLVRAKKRSAEALLLSLIHI